MSEDWQPVKVKKKIYERDIEGPVCRYAKTKGFMAEKFTSPQKRSVPDRVFSGTRRRLFYIEFKAPGKKPTTKQLLDHERRKEMGFQVYVVDNVQQGKEIIDMWAEL